MSLSVESGAKKSQLPSNYTAVPRSDSWRLRGRRIAVALNQHHQRDRDRYRGLQTAYLQRLRLHTGTSWRRHQSRETRVMQSVGSRVFSAATASLRAQDRQATPSPAHGCGVAAANNDCFSIAADPKALQVLADETESRSSRPSLSAFREKVIADLQHQSSDLLTGDSLSAIEGCIERLFLEIGELVLSEQESVSGRFCLARVYSHPPQSQKLALIYRGSQLGQGGFGTVERVCCAMQNSRALGPYALKWVHGPQDSDAEGERSLLERIEQPVVIKKPMSPQKKFELAHQQAQESFSKALTINALGTFGLQLPPIALLRSQGHEPRVGILMPLYSTDLHRYEIRSFQDFKRVFALLGEAVFKLHARGYYHRDIKPQNVFLIPAEGKSECSGVDYERFDLGDLDEASSFSIFDECYELYRLGKLNLQTCTDRLFGNFSMDFASLEAYNHLCLHMEKWKAPQVDVRELRREFIAIMRSRDIYAFAMSFVVKLLGYAQRDEKALESALLELGATQASMGEFIKLLNTLFEAPPFECVERFDQLNSMSVAIPSSQALDYAAAAASA